MGLSDCGGFFLRSGEGFDREGEVEGGFLGRGDGVLGLPDSDLEGVWVWVRVGVFDSGTVIRSNGASGGVLTVDLLSISDEIKLS